MSIKLAHFSRVRDNAGSFSYPIFLPSTSETFHGKCLVSANLILSETAEYVKRFKFKGFRIPLQGFSMKIIKMDYKRNSSDDMHIHVPS